ncbi:ABC transporter ATP-binding protein [Uliginosibacterium flavum]|uniref:ABC transporter ATP-binding protein n=1 Tax=Uliginosibacterium flavum TaxID=1396831 RepID=A0ABV2TJQ7_9RHOO
MALLEIRDVSRRFGDLLALDQVSLSIEAGEFFTLLGPSGCGKTTLLRLIAGFDEPDAGSLWLDGAPLAGIPPERRPVHTVFQSYALFPHMTVAQNVAFPLRMAGAMPDELRERVRATLAQVHLEDKDRAYPHELSGGQKQRVALARGLVGKPRVLLLDEPLGALDAKLRLEMQIELIRLQREVGVTFVFVTHAQVEALALSHRIAVMNAGRIEQVDEPDRLYTAPANRFVTDFIGTSNFMAAEVLPAGRSQDRDQLHLKLCGLGEILAPGMGIAAGTHGSFAIRPEHVRVIGPDHVPELRNHFSGRVRELLYRGDVTVYRIQLGDNGTEKTIEALMANSAPGRARFFEPGQTVQVCWRQDAGLFLHE